MPVKKRNISFKSADGKTEIAAYIYTDEERAPFLAPLGQFVNDWKASCEGEKPEVIDAVYKYAQERSKFYTEEMRAGKYGDYKM